MTWIPASKPEEEALPRRIDASLAALAGRLGLPSPRVVSSLFAQWDELVGTPLSQHVRPVHLDGTTLVLETTEPGWATQVRFLSGDLVRKLAERVPEAAVENIVVRVRGERPRRPRPE
jgi:predicted nucleic acid-binding Zn ribbon protein